MIQVTDLSKYYGSKLALDGVSLTIPTGAVWGMLGQNGSGKSTFLKCLLGFLIPEQGTIERRGIALREVGYLPERVFFPPHARVAEYLHTAGALSGLDPVFLRRHIPALLAQVGLAQAADWQIRRCSKGMQQRLGIAQAIVHDPALLVLDEPMEGLDPAWQYRVRQLIHDWHAAGKTILLSTHRLSDITELCTHVGIFRRGRLVVAGALAEVSALPPRLTIGVATLSPALHAELAALHPKLRVQGTTLRLEGEALALKPLVLARLLAEGVDILHLAHTQHSLEALYLEATTS